MTNLPVLLRGSLFPEGGEYRVHSVFASAINLVGTTDPYPLALLTRPSHAHPRSAVVQVSAGTDLRLWGLEAGTAAAMHSGVLRFDASATVVDFTRARGFPEKILPGRIEPQTLGRVREAVASRQCLLETTLRIDGLAAGSAIGARIAEALALLPADWEAGARRLVGLGNGLTPTGDDVLVGWSAALQARGRPLPPVGELKSLTNLISAAFLDSAERGLFPLALVRWVQALVDGADWAGPLEELASIGHSSGLDAATGFLAGIHG